MAVATAHHAHRPVRSHCHRATAYAANSSTKPLSAHTNLLTSSQGVLSASSTGTTSARRGGSTCRPSQLHSSRLPSRQAPCSPRMPTSEPAARSSTGYSGGQ